MTVGARGPLLVHSLVELASALVEDFDLTEITDLLVDRCVALLEVDVAGLVLSNGNGDLHVMSSTSEATHRIEVLQVRTGEGPCVDAFRTGEEVLADLASSEELWPDVSRAAHALGFRGVHAFPLKTRTQTIGALNLFTRTPVPLSEDDVFAARALVNVTTIAVMQHRTLNATQRVVDQLTGALQSRIVIEQAKGRLMESGGLRTVDEAFEAMRRYARSHHQRLNEVAHAVMTGALTTDVVLGSTR